MTEIATTIEPETEEQNTLEFSHIKELFNINPTEIPLTEEAEKEYQQFVSVIEATDLIDQKSPKWIFVQNLIRYAKHRGAKLIKDTSEINPEKEIIAGYNGCHLEEFKNPWDEYFANILVAPNKKSKVLFIESGMFGGKNTLVELILLKMTEILNNRKKTHGIIRAVSSVMREDHIESRALNIKYPALRYGPHVEDQIFDNLDDETKAQVQEIEKQIKRCEYQIDNGDENKDTLLEEIATLNVNLQEIYTNNSDTEYNYNILEDEINDALDEYNHVTIVLDEISFLQNGDLKRAMEFIQFCLDKNITVIALGLNSDFTGTPLPFFEQNPQKKFIRSLRVKDICKSFVSPKDLSEEKPTGTNTGRYINLYGQHIMDLGFLLPQIVSKYEKKKNGESLVYYTAEPKENVMNSLFGPKFTESLVQYMKEQDAELKSLKRRIQTMDDI